MKDGSIKPFSVPVTRSSMPGFEEYIEEIRDLWESRWLTNSGAKHMKLEAELTRYLNVPNTSIFSNGHLALEIAIAAFNLAGEVITTPFTFASTTHAIVRNGLNPIFNDINPDDYTLDVNNLEELITEKTCAIIPVHVYGNICNLEEIERLAAKYNIRVIYDAAHAFGVTVNGVGIGGFGDASMFSFHATKVFNTIEGGAISFRDTSLKPKLESLKNFGITGPETIEYTGGNAKMNEFQAAMGLCNLRHVDEEIKRRKFKFERYTEHLDGTKGIKLLRPQNGVRSNYSYFPVVFDGYGRSRDVVFETLKRHGIFARKYFYPLTSHLQCYVGKFGRGTTPVAEYISRRVLALPMYADLGLDDIDQICRLVKE